MTTRTAVDADDPTPVECSCCGTAGDPTRMVHLGNHPEVALCLRCARWAAKQADEIEDRDRSGPLVLARDGLRAARRTVIQRGWHRLPVLAAPLRWLGRRLP